MMNDIKEQQEFVSIEEMLEATAGFQRIDADKATIDWFAVLLDLITHIDYETKKMWESFAEEVKTNNRFFPEGELLKKINSIADKAICILHEGQIFYRARDYAERDFLKNDIVVPLTNMIKEEFPDLNFNIADILDDSAITMLTMKLCEDQEKQKRFSSTIDSFSSKKSSFYGYDRSNSDAPPCGLAKEGRANPKGIRCLYMAEDIKTAILEMRPQLQKMYSVAVIQLTKDAKIFDFTYSPKKLPADESGIITELHRISKEFSKPNFGDSIEYAPTQYLCEYIKRLGFDGIKYKSAVSEKGINILLFDVNESTRVYDITGSKVYSVKFLDAGIDQVFPMAE